MTIDVNGFKMQLERDSVGPYVSAAGVKVSIPYVAYDSLCDDESEDFDEYIGLYSRILVDELSCRVYNSHSFRRCFNND